MERIRKQHDNQSSACSRDAKQTKSIKESQASELSSQINNSPRMVAQRQQIQTLFGDAIQRQGGEEEGMLQAAQLTEGAAPKASCNGLPDNLKSGIESLSGISMDSVNVHYNSSKPAQLNAHAYAQGTDIHLAPGQERHLPHEAWHVVQQAQGRVKPTMQMKEGAVNDDKGLEHEADVMGAKAATVAQAVRQNVRPTSHFSRVVQRATLEIGKTFHYTPANRNQGQLGLGEKLTLTSAATGADHENQGTGAAVYNKESGSGTLVGDEYTADGTDGDVQFSVKRDDEPNELKDTLDMTVVAPDSAEFSAVTSNSGGYGVNVAGAGFIGKESVYGPNTVSFRGLLFREGEDEAETSGSFKKWDKLKHDLGDWAGVNEQNKEVGVEDDISSGGITKAEFDDPDNGGPGLFKWQIPWEYKVPGKAAEALITATHQATLDAEGKMTMEKLNGNEERAVDGGPW